MVDDARKMYDIITRLCFQGRITKKAGMSLYGLLPLEPQCRNWPRYLIGRRHLKSMMVLMMIMLCSPVDKCTPFFLVLPFPSTPQQFCHASPTIPILLGQLQCLKC